MFMILLFRELRIGWRNAGDLLVTLGFFVLGVSLFAIAFGGDVIILRRSSSGILWVLLLLSVMLGQDRIFSRDKASGFLSDIALRGNLLGALVWSKVVGLFLSVVVPLVLFSVPTGLLLQVPLSDIFLMILVLFLGLSSLCFLVVFGSALVLGSVYGSLLLSVLVLPLSVPLLIFGESALSSIFAGSLSLEHLLFLFGYLIFNGVVCPLATIYLLLYNMD